VRTPKQSTNKKQSNILATVEGRTSKAQMEKRVTYLQQKREEHQCTNGKRG
jgi:hypothetical protein